jgi:gas vesicle structural protein
VAVQRESGGATLVDVIDRILDKGIVIDAWVRVSVVGIELITVEARIVIASIETYLQHSHALGASLRASPPPTVRPDTGSSHPGYPLR